MGELVEGFAHLILTFLGGVGGWFTQEASIRRGRLLRSRAVVVLHGSERLGRGREGGFPYTLPKGTLVRVNRVSHGAEPTSWVTPTDKQMCEKIAKHIGKTLAAEPTFEFELSFADYRYQFDEVAGVIYAGGADAAPRGNAGFSEK